MSSDRSIITLSPHVTTTIVEAVQRAIIDKGACRATRKAALSALLALVDAGLLKESRSTNSSVRDETAVTEWLLTGHQG
jgi:hypothetical protein